MRQRSGWMKVLAMLFAFALVAAACGDDDGGGGEVLGGDEPGATTEAPAETTAASGGGETTEAPAETTEGSSDTTAASGGGGLADESVHGVGASAYEAAINDPPGPADDSLEPVLITMANLEGDALGSFPEIREGLEIATELINTQLGGIGGRPVELDVCVHGFDPNAATNCANEIVAANPNLNINGIEFFTPLLYPTFLEAGVTTIQTVPIFVADFDTPDVISPSGGCVVSFPSAAEFTVETLQMDKIVVLYSNTPPGLECFADTQERFWDFLATENDFEWIGLPDNSGDPSDNDAIVQQMADFFQGAENAGVFFGIQASDCNEILSAIDAAGLDATVVASGSCIDDSVLANPASAGAYFGQAGYIAERPDLYDDYIAFELTHREDLLDNSPIRNAPVSAFLRTGYNVGIFAWQTLGDVVAEGGDIDDPATVLAKMKSLENYHVVGAPPVTCTNPAAEFRSICDLTITYVIWSGSEWEVGPPLNGEYVDVSDILARVAEGNPRG